MESTTFNYTGELQHFVVPANITSITITAIGARGGVSNRYGGKGASITGDFAVKPGQELAILVGEAGGYGPAPSGGGGGGGSFVWSGTKYIDLSITTLLVSAGGGGGTGAGPGLNANTKGDGFDGVYNDGSGGKNGSGGDGGGGGAGISGNGGGNRGGTSIQNGGAGGPAAGGGGRGGYGGGGGGNFYGDVHLKALGGGGGGYSGGGSGGGIDDGGSGGGGGSYNTGTNQINTLGVGNDDGQVTIISNMVNPQLSITKTASPDPVLVGQNLAYAITITNTGSAQATNLLLTDTLPKNVELVSSSGCSEASGTLTCCLGTLNVNTSTTVNLVVKPKENGTIANFASAKCDELPDPVTANISTQVVLPVGFTSTTIKRNWQKNPPV